MVSLVRRCSLEEALASQIRAFITRYLKFDVGSIGDGSHLSGDLGLDLMEVTELMIVLEEQFGVEGEIADEPAHMEFVGDLVRYIEDNKRAVKGVTESGQMISSFTRSPACPASDA
jgi:acyl carrier protein